MTKFGDLVDCGLPRCSLKISAADAAVYQGFTDLILKETAAGDSILAIPNDAELYFLSGRRNPTRFYNASQGTTTPELQREVFRVLQDTPPRLVIFRPGDKYNTRATAELMTEVRSRYEFLGNASGTEIYRRRAPER